MKNDVEIVCYTASEAGEYFGPENAMQWNVLPFSPARLKFLIHSPFLSDSDVVLCVAKKGKKILSFCSGIPDYLFNGQKVYWNTGWWAVPEGTHYASSVLLQWIKMCNENVLFNDLTPLTYAYMKSFSCMHIFSPVKGKKFIFRFYIPRSYPYLKFFHKELSLINFFSERYLSFKKHSLQKRSSAYTLHEIGNMNENQVDSFLYSFSSSLTRWNMQKIKHLWQYPWVSTEDRPLPQFPFTYHVNSYETKGWVITEKDRITGIMLLSEYNKHLKIPIIFFSHISALEVMMHLLKRYIYEKKICTLTTFQPAIIAAMRSYALISKEVMIYRACSRSLKDVINGRHWQDGEGDWALT